MIISDANIQRYITKKYGIDKPILTDNYSIKGLIPLDQDDRGGDNDCTLHSITTIIDYLTNHTLDVEDIYAIVRMEAQKFFYTDKKGTNPIFISTLLRRLFKFYNINLKVNCGRYFKNICYNFNSIKNSINNNIPIILNIWNSGNNSYHNHTVTIIGYKCYNNIKFLEVYDNWYKYSNYIDFSKLSIISSINKIY